MLYRCIVALIRKPTYSFQATNFQRLYWSKTKEIVCIYFQFDQKSATQMFENYAHESKSWYLLYELCGHLYYIVAGLLPDQSVAIELKKKLSFLYNKIKKTPWNIKIIFYHQRNKNVSYFIEL